MARRRPNDISREDFGVIVESGASAEATAAPRRRLRRNAAS
jgi:hypothetical protein